MAMAQASLESLLYDLADILGVEVSLQGVGDKRRVHTHKVGFSFRYTRVGEKSLLTSVAVQGVNVLLTILLSNNAPPMAHVFDLRKVKNAEKDPWQADLKPVVLVYDKQEQEWIQDATDGSSQQPEGQAADSSGGE